MTNSEMLAWAERWHYPHLLVSGKDAIRHGRQNWEAFVASKDEVRKILAEQRIRQWEAVASQKKRVG